MPIITPAFPSMCATHTVMPSTLRIMKEEFGRADKIVQHIFSGSKSWDALFERHSFFTKDHKYYLSVVAASRSKDANSKFSGLVQSKIRHIVKGIDDGQTGIDTARPYIEYFERFHRCKGEGQVQEVTQGVLDYMIPASEVPAEGTVPADEDIRIIYTTTFYIGLTLPQGMLTYFAFVLHITDRPNRWYKVTRYLLSRQSVQELHYRVRRVRRRHDVREGRPHPQV
jgi:poly(A) polymerase